VIIYPKISLPKVALPQADFHLFIAADPYDPAMPGYPNHVSWKARKSIDALPMDIHPEIQNNRIKT
jgi:hypothetical protein